MRTKTFSTHVTPKSGHDVRGKRQNTHENLLLPELYGKTAASGHEHRNHTLRCDILLRNHVSLRILLTSAFRSICINLRHVCLSWVEEIHRNIQRPAVLVSNAAGKPLT